MNPDIRYARSGGAAIAYQVVGDGPVDLVFVPDYVSNLVFGWESPHWRTFYEALASFSRLILFDKRGTGLSDHTGGFPTLETRMEDLHAVLDAVGSHRTVVVAAQEGCGLACLFAATYPERTAALVLFQPAAMGAADLVGDTEQMVRDLSDLRDRWGTQAYSDELLAEIAPSLAANEADRIWFANHLRVSASPAAAYALNRMYVETDLREVLPAVRVPTLLLYRGAELESFARDVQQRVSGARLTRVPGEDFWGIFLSPEIPIEIERFIQGAEGPLIPDRLLTTLLFTDLVGSTALAADVGDAKWRELLAQHNAVVRRELLLHRGREVDTTGDGFFAIFDGPARAIHCADAIRRSLAELHLPVRAGVHTGECEILSDKPAGIAVHVAARIAALAKADEILVSATVCHLVAGSGIRFESRGARALAGVPDEVDLYSVEQL
jgi:class 3 adenylate cyclase/pimeloyl-ACP methyl ester carboxylesterase